MGTEKELYGKYGTLAKKYLEEHEPARYWALGKDLPEYLHGIDRQAGRDVRYDICEAVRKGRVQKDGRVSLRRAQGKRDAAEDRGRDIVRACLCEITEVRL